MGVGVVFALDSGGGYVNLHSFSSSDPADGSTPYGSVTLVGSNVYGMTYNGGASDASECGTGSPVAVTVKDTDLSATQRFLRLRVTLP